MKDYNTFSGLFSVTLDDDEMVFKLSYDIYGKPFRINLMMDNDIYGELSIIIPDSDELDKGEFFMDSKIDYRIVDEMVSQGFISKSGKIATAGEDEVNSYKINFQ